MFNNDNHIKSYKLRKILINENLCIRNNPEGIDKLWPKSYIDDFYESLFEKKQSKNQLRILIEINNKNNKSIFLWKSYLSKLNIYKFKFINNNLFLDKNYDQELLCDMAIINSGNNIKNLNKLIKDVLPYLNIEGYLVVEDIGLESKKMFSAFIKTPLYYELSLCDFRVKRLILNNAILSIKRSRNSIFLNFFNRLLMSFNLLFFLLINFLLSLYPKISNHLKKFF